MLYIDRPFLLRLNEGVFGTSWQERKRAVGRCAGYTNDKRRHASLTTRKDYAIFFYNVTSILQRRWIESSSFLLCFPFLWSSPKRRGKCRVSALKTVEASNALPKDRSYSYAKEKKKKKKRTRFRARLLSITATRLCKERRSSSRRKHCEVDEDLIGKENKVRKKYLVQRVRYYTVR